MRAKPQSGFTPDQVDKLIERAVGAGKVRLGHTPSYVLDLYYQLHDEDSQQAMRALAGAPEETAAVQSPPSPSEDSLRTVAQSTNEKTPQLFEIK